MTATSLSCPGGDDVNAVVLDVGAHLFRAGFAGEDVPRVVKSSSWIFPNDLSDFPMESNSRTFQGTPFSSTSYMDEPERLVKSVISRDGSSGMVTLNEDVFRSILGYSFKNRAGALDIDIHDSPIILTEPNRTSLKYRKVCLETCLEEFDFPAMSLLRRASASAFASGKPSGLVLDVGASSTSLVPVYDGFVLQKPILEYHNIGGNLLDSVLDEVLKKKRVNVTPYGNHSSMVDINKSSQLYQLSRLVVVREIKQEVCKLSPTPLTGEPGYGTWNMAQNSTSTVNDAVLPDGTKVDLGYICQIIPEILFDPAPLGVIPSLAMLTGTFPGIPLAVKECVNSVDVDARKAVSSDIILTGGSSLFEGMADRVLKAAGNIAGVPKCKVTASPVSIDRTCTSWLGCSIIASCASFQQMWISKKQFAEDGLDRIAAKQLYW